MLSAQTMGPTLPSEEAKHSWLLTSYVERYPAGRSRARRLLHLASSEAEPALAQRAAGPAGAEIRRSTDPTLQVRLQKRYPALSDDSWIETTERANRVRREQLDKVYQRAKAEALKEPSRQALVDLGAFFQEIGDPEMSLRSLNMAKEMCMTSQHRVDVYLRLAEALLWESRDPDRAASWARSLEMVVAALPTSPATADARNRAKIVLGLCELRKRHYRAAAKHLFAVGPELGRGGEVAREDVATLATLCGLASYAREEIQSAVFETPGFKALLESVPTVKEMARRMLDCEYRGLFELLREGEALLGLDPLLSGPEAAKALMQEIRTQAIKQYALPFSTMKIESMAQAFGLTAQEAEAQLALAITEGGLTSGRIDSQQKVLVTLGGTPGEQAQAEAARVAHATMEMAKSFRKETQHAMLRMALMTEGVVHSGPTELKGGSSGRNNESESLQVNEEDEDDAHSY